MNVFFISPGRTGTTTISLAFSCIEDWSSEHESRSSLLGEERINYSDNHFECDNRLVWFLPRLTKKYSKSGILVIVNREQSKTASSYNKRWGGIGIMRAYSQGILMRKLHQNNLDVCSDYVQNVYEHLDFFRREWQHVVDLDIDNPKAGVCDLLELIGKTEYKDKILNQFSQITANKNRKTIKVKARQFLQNVKILYQDLFKYQKIYNLTNSNIQMKSKDLFLKTGLVGLTKVLSALIAFFMTMLITRSISPDESGLLLLLITVLTVLSTVVRLGLDNIILRLTSSSPNSTATTNKINTSITWISLFSISTALIISLSGGFISNIVFSKPEFHESLSIGILALPFLSIFMLLAKVFQGMNKIVTSIFFLNLGISIVFIFLFSSLSLTGLTLNAKYGACLYLVSSIIIFIIAIYLTKRLGISSIPTLRPIDKELWQSALNLWIASLSVLAVQWASILISGAFIEANEFSKLMAAQRTAALTSFVLMIINIVVAPRFASMWKQNKLDELQSLARWSCRAAALIATPSLIIFIFFAKPVLSIFGDSYSDAASLLTILAVGQYINVLTGPTGFLLTMTGHEIDYRKVTVYAGLFTILISFIFIYYFGAIGAAISGAIGLSIQNIGGLYLVRKRLGFFPIGQLFYEEFHSHQELRQELFQLNKILKKIEKYWRKFNFFLHLKKNNIYIAKGSYISPESSIGKHTRINHISHIGRCQIGKFCAIGGRLVVRSSNHYTQYANIQSVFQKKFIGSDLKVSGKSNDTVIIGNAVWIGDSVIILPGVKVGNGAIIGAGSVVTKSIPDFAVAVGNPAKVIKYRFNEKTISFFNRINWWDWSDEKIIKNKSFFEIDFSEVSEFELDKIEVKLQDQVAIFIN